MNSIWVSIVIVLILIVANGLFAMTEIAIVTSKKNRLEKLKEQGDRRAAYALKLAEDPNQLLSTIQIGITLIGVITGAFGGATIAGQLSGYVERIDALSAFSYQLSFIIVVGLSTYLSLIIGELVPKRIGLNNPEKTASIVAKPMYYFSKIGKPLIFILSKSTEFVLKVLRVKPNDEPDVTEEEITQLIEQGVYSGVVESIEQDLVEQIFYLGDKRLGDILTPRPQLVWLDLEDPLEENIKIMKENSYSRFPVGEGTLDNFKGIVHAKDMFAKLVSDEHFDLTECIRQTIILPESMKAFQAMEMLKKSAHHEAIVIDEYGGVEGLVTLHDVFEHIIGEMPEEHETELQIVQRNENSWLADGLIPIDTFVRYFDLEGVENLTSNKNFHTLGGFITSQKGEIPKVKDEVRVGDLLLEVVDMDQFRVDKVMVSRVEESSLGEM
ncbi:hemolysin family protein [Priestia flexa]|uniref:Hemolysin family protein n=2 Tax=Priestia flexa TaxID=86664 RepID=A0ABU4J0T8_9BACI|nr:hemolysin family protein [Priestia flexa]MCG7314271.1 hemolysin family protein [Priestia flexa]MCM3066974.1 hemolysin family protein [Priestia flexa]MDW8514849.1 hemolysin family protein [Priestia flexa]RIV14152.1 HlyC/CorC family transporter [Priestia flexa]UZW66670.1 hemolysin family protein [Priestia flexa]